MSVTSIFLDTKIPTTAFTRNINDFKLPSIFSEMPKSDADWIGKYYFGNKTSQLLATSDYSSEGNNLHPNGEIFLSNGYLFADKQDYFDTGINAPVKLSLALTMKRPSNSAVYQWVVTSFKGAGANGSGIAIGIQNGTLYLFNQIQGGATTRASIALPSSIAIGQNMAITSYVSGTVITISVYDPSQSSIVYNSNNSSTHNDETRSLLVGAKYDNNTDASSMVKVILILNGDIGAATTTSSTTSIAAHNELCQYLLTID